MAKKKVTKKADPNRYPAGISARKMKSIIAHYERQSDAEAIAEAKAAYRRRTTTMIEVPTRLLPQIQLLLSKS